MSIDEDIYQAANNMNVEANRKDEFIKQLQYEQYCISDLEHYLELGDNLDAIKLTQTVLALKKHLIKRRELKDKLDAIKVLRSANLVNFMKYLEGRKTRKYTPRVMTHLGIMGAKA